MPIKHADRSALELVRQKGALDSPVSVTGAGDRLAAGFVACDGAR